MGSFDATCAFSRLPIKAGDPVKLLLLVEAPYKDNIRCYADCDFSPLGPAIDAAYNDYGSVEEYDESNPSVRIMFENWPDVVELPTGENAYHDVPVYRGMPSKDWLDAVWEGRLRILGSKHDGPDSSVRWCMIHEFVWDHMVGVPVEAYTSSTGTFRSVTLNLEEHLLAPARATWNVHKQLKEQLDQSLITQSKYRLETGFSCDHDETPFSNTFHSIHGRRFIRRSWNYAQSIGLSDSEVETFLRDLCELIKVDWSLPILRKVWVQGDIVGGQCGEMTAHINFAKAVTEFASARQKEHEEQKAYMEEFE